MKRQQATESKIEVDASNAFFGLSKKGREGFTGLQLCLTVHHILTVNRLFLSLVVHLKIVTDEKQNAYILLPVSLTTITEKTGYDV
jgi:hypothetical protein